MWKKELTIVAENKVTGVRCSEESMARARYILNKREGDGKTSPPVKGMSFYPFKEDLPHHIRKTYVIINTGSPLSFFDNPYVRDLLSAQWPESTPPPHVPCKVNQVTAMCHRCIPEGGEYYLFICYHCNTSN